MTDQTAPHPSAEAPSIPVRSHVFGQGWRRREVIVSRPGAGHGTRLVLRCGPLRLDLRVTEALRLADMIVDAVEHPPHRTPRRTGGHR